jgi:UDP:flavonoid glycosyltransferase YjiC (YdhE family)
MPRTALLCAEVGGGLGHISSLRVIGDALKRLGWRTTLIVPHDRAAPPRFLSGHQFAPGPSWRDYEPGPSRTSASLGDTLADLGLKSADMVRRQLARWRELFARHSPDLIVANYAPGAVLAARSTLPCVVVGTGFTVPPAGLRSFPRLHDRSPPLHDEREVCAAVNAALSDFGAPLLANLTDVLLGDAQCAATLPLLDPYAAIRRAPALGPLLVEPSVRRDDAAGNIFCYLRQSPRVRRLDDISNALLGLPATVYAYLPGLSAGQACRLRDAGIEIMDEPARLAEQLRDARLVIHTGGHGVAAAALLAGVPQVVIAQHIEMSLTGRALARRGVGTRFDFNRDSVDAIHHGVLAALEDPVLTREAGRAAEEYECYRERDVAGEVAATCERLALMYDATGVRR